MAAASNHTPVLIVGGGPVGFALAGDLGWRGVPCVLIEKTDGAVVQPKMDLVGVRTMEFCRRWGIVDEIKAGKLTYSGIAVEAVKVDNPLQLINLAAPVHYGFAEANLVRDPVARPSGLKIFSIAF